jgi:hypothetical protein
VLLQSTTNFFEAFREAVGDGKLLSEYNLTLRGIPQGLEAQLDDLKGARLQNISDSQDGKATQPWAMHEALGSSFIYTRLRKQPVVRDMLLLECQLLL